MMRPTESARPLARGLVVLGGIALVIVTLAHPGATRMHEWPWSCVYGAVCAIPVLLLALRLFDAREPLVLPPPAWSTAVVFMAGVMVTGAMASPYRAQCLLWSAPLLAGLALVLVTFDWLHAAPAQFEERRRQLLIAGGFFSAIIALTSAVLWARGLTAQWREQITSSRNPFPLGHSNYTAGLALLMLPLFAALAVITTGWRRLGWLLLALLAVALLFSSGSRGGLLGLVALAFVNIPAIARVLRLRLWLIALTAAVVLLALFYFNPRARSLITGERSSAVIRESNDQRSAMLAAGLVLGGERPVFGWGSGATPLAYPLVRHRLFGGVEDVLQLHDTPLQLYAEFGTLGVLAALWAAVLAGCAAWKSGAVRPVFLGLVGYAVFCVTDWQLDVPIFAAALALGFALLAPAATNPPPVFRRILGAVMVVTLGLFAVFARPDPAPEINVRALALARDPAHADAAIALFRSSLALNPNQEIAYFNLGWLLVVRDPAAAERHFLAAAQLVPDKGGVYFGLAMACLNQGQRAAATRALALECLNDPLFLTSPWWRVPALADLRANAQALTSSLLASLPTGRAFTSEAHYLAALMAWLDDRAVPGEILAAANTSERVGYFARRPTRPDFAAAPLRTYRRERIGYPVLMRNLDLPVPTDLFDVQENFLAATEFSFLFPRKGWLPAPVLLPLLAAEKPKS